MFATLGGARSIEIGQRRSRCHRQIRKHPSRRSAARAKCASSPTTTSSARDPTSDTGRLHRRASCGERRRQRASRRARGTNTAPLTPGLTDSWSDTPATAMGLHFAPTKGRNMVVGLEDYALAAGISRRAAQFRARNGQVKARRIGGVWVVEASEVAVARVQGRMPPGRPVSSEAFERLSAYLDGEHARMSPEYRRQASVLASRLRVDDNVSALRNIGRARLGEARPYLADERDFSAIRNAVENGQAGEVLLAGISDSRQGLTNPLLLELYLHHDHAQRMVSRHRLSPADGPAWNVMLRSVDRIPPRRSLRVAADLLDGGDARSVAEASRIAHELAEAAT